MNSRTKAVIVSVLAAIALAFLIFITSSCTSCSPGHRHLKHVYGAVYQDKETGHYYTRSYDSSTDSFWFYMYILNSGSTTNVYPSSPAYIYSGISSGQGSWQRVSADAVPKADDLVKTNEVVEENTEGQPTAQVVEETAEIAHEEITENTDQAQIEAMENEGGMQYSIEPSNEPSTAEPSTDSPSSTPDSSTPDSSPSSDSGGSADSGGGGDN